MIKLKDILLETQIAHTQKSLQWVYHGYIAMTPKVIKQIMGDVPITTFHNLDWFPSHDPSTSNTTPPFV